MVLVHIVEHFLQILKTVLKYSICQHQILNLLQSKIYQWKIFRNHLRSLRSFVLDANMENHKKFNHFDQLLREGLQIVHNTFKCNSHNGILMIDRLSRTENLVWTPWSWPCVQFYLTIDPVNFVDRSNHKQPKINQIW